MAAKIVELTSGTVITKQAGDGYDEIWEIESKAIANTIVTLDMSSCTGCVVDGHEGEQTITENVRPMYPPFKFVARINMMEEPIPIEEQDYYLKDQIDSLQEKVEVIKALIEGIPFENIDETYMQNFLGDHGIDHFIDPSFPPDDTSIWDQRESYPLKEKPVWKRVKDIVNGTPKVFFEGIDPNDIKQGALGDCWFLASIASIAENPALVKRLFITQDYNECGFYKLKICKDGEWIEVVVDDYFPCYCNGGPMFSRCQGDEIWVLLLEKAYAKLHRNYCALRGGFVEHGMGDLTGCPTNFNKFPAERKFFYQITSYADDLWHNLIKCDNKGYIMCASTPGVDQFTESNGPNQETGIVAGHAYSVISCKEYDGIRLLKIRNPWGSFEWGGAWSDNAPEWTQEYIDYFQPDFNSNDGTFWMCYEDFFKNFESINVCKVADWKEVRLKGKFIRLWELEDTDEDWVLSKFYYSFRLEETAKIDICLHQEDKRIIGADKRRY